MAALGIVIALALGILSLGWGWGIEELTRIFPGYGIMVPSTAVLLLMLSTSLFFRLKWPHKALFVSTAQLAAALAMVLALANIAVIVFAGMAGLDEAIWPGNPAFQDSQQSVATSVNIILVTLALGASNFRYRFPAAFVVPATAGLVLATVAFLSFLLGSEALHSHVYFDRLSFPSTISFLILFNVLLVAHGDVGWIAHFRESGQGGKIARRLIPVVVLIPLVLTILASVGHRAGIFDVDFLLSAIAIIMICVLTAFVLATTRQVSEAERELLRSVDEVRTALDRAEAAEMTKSNFLANMSHELRTPMNAVIGFTDLLLDSDPTPDQRRQLELIAESGSAMMSLLDSILELAKIEAGKTIIEDTPFDLHHAIKRCVRLMWGAAEQKGLDLRLKIADDVPRFIHGDRFRIRQILINLIGNAIKFTPGGWIGVTLELTGGPDGRPMLQIAVADTGIGMAPEHQADVFDDFTQADSSITRKFGGTGLGLTICRKLAGLMDGEIRFDSKLGHGTTFYFTMPVREARGIEETTESVRPSPLGMAGAEGTRVLVAEDNEINAMLLSAQMERLGIGFDVAHSGNEAIRMIKVSRKQERPYSLVLMDVQMPEMDGREATRELRANGISARELPVIAVTAHAFQEDIEACVSAGMQDHIAKPVQIGELRDKLVRWLPVTGVEEEETPGGIAYPESTGALYARLKHDLIHAIEQCVSDFPKTASEDCARLSRLLHNFGGLGPQFGEEELAAQARDLERAIRQWESEEEAAQLGARLMDFQALARAA